MQKKTKKKGTLLKYETDRQTHRPRSGQAAGQTDKWTLSLSTIPPALPVWCGSETRFVTFIFLPSLFLRRTLCRPGSFQLLSFNFVFLFCLSFRPGLPSLLCARDVCLRLRAPCQCCLMETELCVLCLSVCVCLCVCVGVCRFGLFGAGGSCKHLLVGIASMR